MKPRDTENNQTRLHYISGEILEVLWPVWQKLDRIALVVTNPPRSNFKIKKIHPFSKPQFYFAITYKPIVRVQNTNMGNNVSKLPSSNGVGIGAFQ